MKEYPETAAEGSLRSIPESRMVVDDPHIGISERAFRGSSFDIA
jgi:hypothetical protein